MALHCQSECELLVYFSSFLQIHFRVERSTDQVIKAINLEALSKWVPHFPKDVFDDLINIAPMLQILGYDIFDSPPKYDEIDMKINYAMIENYGGKRNNRMKSDYNY